MDFGRSGLLGLIVQRHVRVGLDTELGLAQTLHHSTMDINVMLMVRLIGKIRIATLESVVSLFSSMGKCYMKLTLSYTSF